MTQTKFTSRFLMGKVNNECIYLSAPNWDCGWYWGFGYLGNKDCHYHLNGLNNKINLYDAIREHFGKSLTIKEDKDIWTFCELVLTAYSLKETAEVLGRGGSHMTKNPCQNIIKNEVEEKRINEIVLPAIFNAIEDIISKYR